MDWFVCAPVQYWYSVLVPEVQSRFRYTVNPRTVHRPALFLAMQYHVRAFVVRCVCWCLCGGVLFREGLCAGANDVERWMGAV